MLCQLSQMVWCIFPRKVVYIDNNSFLLNIIVLNLHNWRLNIDQSLRLWKFWFELLTEEELHLGFYTVTQKALTNLGARYALHELCHIPPPYMKTRHNLETITKSFNNDSSKGSFEEALGGWL